MRLNEWKATEPAEAIEEEADAPDPTGRAWPLNRAIRVHSGALAFLQPL
jgi:hypothetical protein